MDARASWNTRSGEEPAEGARGSGASAAGFTLIELIAVLMILSILAYFLVKNVTGAQELVEEGLTRARLAEISAALEEYADEQGDFPLGSKLPGGGGPPNATNLGGEALYLALCAEGAPGFGVLDTDLCNTDGDRTPKRLPGFESQELFELCDGWGNPIAYLHHREYERTDVYLSLDGATGEELEGAVRARRNEKTKRFHEPSDFQLISAGVDGDFGTEDDIANFKP